MTDQYGEGDEKFHVWKRKWKMMRLRRNGVLDFLWQKKNL